MIINSEQSIIKKATPRHMTVKLLNTYCNVEILKVPRETHLLPIKLATVRLINGFSKETLGAKTTE